MNAKESRRGSEITRLKSEKQTPNCVIEPLKNEQQTQVMDKNDQQSEQQRLKTELQRRSGDIQGFKFEFEASSKVSLVTTNVSMTNSIAEIVR